MHAVAERDDLVARPSVGLAASGRAPIRPVTNVLPGSASAAPPMPTKPPPAWM